jgi:hypothetical protein
MLSGAPFPSLSSAGHIRINHDAPAIFTYDDLLSQLDIHLFLRRYLIETPATGTTLDRHYSQAVTSVLADSFESSQQTGLNRCLGLLCLLADFLFLRLGF